MRDGGLSGAAEKSRVAPGKRQGAGAGPGVRYNREARSSSKCHVDLPLLVSERGTITDDVNDDGNSNGGGSNDGADGRNGPR